jgi:hypothetical protein
MYIYLRRGGVTQPYGVTTMATVQLGLSPSYLVSDWHHTERLEVKKAHVQAEEDLRHNACSIWYKILEFIGFSVFRDHHLCQGLPSGEAHSLDAARDQKKGVSDSTHADANAAGSSPERPYSLITTLPISSTANPSRAGSGRHNTRSKQEPRFPCLGRRRRSLGLLQRLAAAAAAAGHPRKGRSTTDRVCARGGSLGLAIRRRSRHTGTTC